MLTREEALDVLKEITDDELIDEEYRAAVATICTAIDFERIGVHLWSVPDDEIKRLSDGDETLLDKYLYVPSDFEEKEIDEFINSVSEEYPSEDVSATESDEKGENDKSIDQAQKTAETML